MVKSNAHSYVEHYIFFFNLKFVKKKKKKETGKFPADAPVGSRQALFPTKETVIQPMEADT